MHDPAAADKEIVVRLVVKLVVKLVVPETGTCMTPPRPTRRM